jgi:FKBP-type peptidyl-prolyl cis-trans isomerase
VFDSSGANPVTFGVTQVIPGWTEALQMMKPGGKMRIWVPSDLGYGAMPQGKIEPNSTLIFDMELVEVMKDANKQSAAGGGMHQGHP